MKLKTESTQQKIRKVQKAFDEWMVLRQTSPISGMTHLQRTAEAESLRLAPILAALKAKHAAQVKALEGGWRRGEACHSDVSLSAHSRGM